MVLMFAAAKNRYSDALRITWRKGTLSLLIAHRLIHLDIWCFNARVWLRHALWTKVEFIALFEVSKMLLETRPNTSYCLTIRQAESYFLNGPRYLRQIEGPYESTKSFEKRRGIEFSHPLAMAWKKSYCTPLSRTGRHSSG